MVLLFSFFFCSGGFLVAHAESVTVVISGSNVTSKPSGWDGNSTYNRVVHYPTTKPEGLLNSYYDALSLSDIGYVTFDTLFRILETSSFLILFRAGFLQIFLLLLLGFLAILILIRLVQLVLR